MNIVMASDHAGFELKESLKKLVTSLGHTVNDVGAHAYDSEDDYSFCRASIFMGAKALQNSGIVVINHDGSEYVAA